MKSFDSLSLSILLNKLSHYRISSCSNELFGSYLSDRLQFVDLNCRMSTELAISTVVPQESVIGLSLFTIYTNELPLVTNFVYHVDVCRWHDIIL